MSPIFFQDQKEFRKWLEKNHKHESELHVGYYKVSTGKPGMTWSESVDEALCFGWIDGIRRSIDEERYTIRFTPRKPASNWSNINLQKVELLKKKGLMRQSGFDVYNSRKISKSGIYSFEKDIAKLTEAFESMFQANSHAWEFFRKQAPSYQKTILGWIMSAKQETTRLARLTKTIIASENNKRIF
jgi:uncharacterized protein YdeI (YjbR/CyaY-like superfamily)